MLLAAQACCQLAASTGSSLVSSACDRWVWPSGGGLSAAMACTNVSTPPSFREKPSPAVISATWLAFETYQSATVTQRSRPISVTTGSLFDRVNQSGSWTALPAKERMLLWLAWTVSWTSRLTVRCAPGRALDAVARPHAGPVHAGVAGHHLHTRLATGMDGDHH